ncbi:hypothetical protein [Bradyrhizobium sp. Tv2a-2]|uniref:hypothetical protein n=1 Tax=Bradyrhizobium sp. Tv2a-2 TaxID=113395 RepID=UPI0004105250|nr:hypothetical protein [Bradyrhizobium sp. Tv2a-2]
MLKISRLSMLLAAVFFGASAPALAQTTETYTAYILGLQSVGALVGNERIGAVQGGTSKATSPQQILGMINGDCSFSASIICTKTNGVAFAPSATINALNAGNINAGVLGSTYGGAGTVNGALKGDGTGNVSKAGCSDLAGVAPSCGTDATNASNINTGFLNLSRLAAPLTSPTVSGNTSQLATVATGTKTANHAATWDVNGNIQDGGVSSGTVTEQKNTAGAGLVTSGNCDNTSTNASSPCQFAVTAGQVPGTATNDNASSGNVGEIIQCNNTVSGMSSGVPFNFCSIVLTPGDWDVSGLMMMTGSPWTVQVVEFGISTTSLTMPSTTGTLAAFAGPFVQYYNVSLAITPYRITVATSTTTTIYAVGDVTWNAGGGSMAARIEARRVR